jgi:hypothetical protein
MHHRHHNRTARVSQQREADPLQDRATHHKEKPDTGRPITNDDKKIREGKPLFDHSTMTQSALVQNLLRIN